MSKRIKFTLLSAETLSRKEEKFYKEFLQYFNKKYKKYFPIDFKEIFVSHNYDFSKIEFRLKDIKHNSVLNIIISKPHFCSSEINISISNKKQLKSRCYNYSNSRDFYTQISAKTISILLIHSIERRYDQISNEKKLIKFIDIR